MSPTYTLPTFSDLAHIRITGTLLPSLKRNGFHLTGSWLSEFNPQGLERRDIDYFVQTRPGLIEALAGDFYVFYQPMNENGGEYSDRNLVAVLRSKSYPQIDIQIVRDADLKIRATNWIVAHLQKEGKVMADIPKLHRSGLWDKAMLAVTQEGDTIRSENFKAKIPF